MRPVFRCAVVAAAFQPDGDRVGAMLSGMGFSEIVRVQNGMDALRMVQSRPVDAVVVDAVLPGLDGFALEERIERTRLTVRPAVIVLTVPGMRMRGGCETLQKPVDEEALRCALERLRPEVREFSPERMRRAEEILDKLGVPEHCGRDYLLRAVMIAWADGRFAQAVTTRLIPAVAARFGVSARHVDRAMRHAIDVAWRSGEIDAQYELFGDTIDAARGCPTCSEMIAQIADILRWEGNA